MLLAVKETSLALQIRFIEARFDAFRVFTGCDSVEDYFDRYFQDYERANGNGSLIVHLCEGIDALDDWAAINGLKIVSQTEWRSAGVTERLNIVETHFLERLQREWMAANGIQVLQAMRGDVDFHAMQNLHRIHIDWNMKLGWWEFSL